MPDSVKQQLNDGILKDIEEKVKKENEERRRKTVYYAIEALADTVDEKKLLSLVNLKQSSHK